jgi:hypothetical protein
MVKKRRGEERRGQIGCKVEHVGIDLQDGNKIYTILRTLRWRA